MGTEVRILIIESGRTMIKSTKQDGIHGHAACHNVGESGQGKMSECAVGRRDVVRGVAKLAYVVPAVLAAMSAKSAFAFS